MKSAKLNVAREAKEAEAKAAAKAKKKKSLRRKSPTKERVWHNPAADHLLSPAVLRAQTCLGVESHAEALLHTKLPAGSATLEFTSAGDLGIKWGPPSWPGPPPAAPAWIVSVRKVSGGVSLDVPFRLHMAAARWPPSVH